MKRYQVRTGNRSAYVVIDTVSTGRMPFDTLESAIEYAREKNRQEYTREGIAEYRHRIGR